MKNIINASSNQTNFKSVILNLLSIGGLEKKDKYTHILENLTNEKFSLKKKKEVDIHKDYGWLTPGGEFIPVEYGEHQRWAFDYIKKDKNLLHELMNSDNSYAFGDFLIDSKGWILLHNSHFGVAKPEYKTMTKTQKDFLNKYYTERNEMDLAIIYRY